MTRWLPVLAAISAWQLIAMLAPVQSEAQTRVKCGMVLGGGQTYVLQKDLTCGQFGDPDDSYAGRGGMVKVVEGATLDLNGHVMTCDPNYSGPFARDPFGIVVRDATVKGGTVRGCAAGIVPSNSFVKGMTLTNNYVGIRLIEKYISGNNFIIGNIFEKNLGGVAIQESIGERLINNVARDNSGFGFSVEDSGATLIGNLALGNGDGFRWSGDGRSGRLARLLGNRAESNGTGFRISSKLGEVIGNVAERNLSHGFDLQIPYASEYDGFRQNVAHANMGDGFSLRVDAPPPAGTMSGNNATNNRGYGIRVRDGFLSSSPPGLTITDNTALNNRVADLGDDTGCSVVMWGTNRFETAAQPCIH